jgi:hypothetical protein
MSSLDINPTRAPRAAVRGTKQGVRGVADFAGTATTAATSIVLSPVAFTFVLAAVAFAWNTFVLADGEEWDWKDYASVLFLTYVARRVM